MPLRSENRRRFVASLMAGVVAVGLTVAPVVAWAADPVIFAAASLKNALDDVAKAYEAKTGHKVTISYAGSSALAKQIEQGAPAAVQDVIEFGWHWGPHPWES